MNLQLPLFITLRAAEHYRLKLLVMPPPLALFAVYDVFFLAVSLMACNFCSAFPQPGLALALFFDMFYLLEVWGLRALSCHKYIMVAHGNLSELNLTKIKKIGKEICG
jgi:hypothetical protein